MNSSEASWAVIPLSSEYSTYKHNRYSKCSFIGPKETRIYRALYRDAMLVPIRMGTNMAAGNQQKHLSLSFDTKALIYLLKNS